jgi:hypothetical protein
MNRIFSKSGARAWSDVALSFICAITIAAFASCRKTNVATTVDDKVDFSSLTREYDFWSEWITKNRPRDPCPLERFSVESEATTGIPKSVDNALKEAATVSGTFVVLVRINVQNGIEEVVSLAGNGKWKITRWGVPTKNGWSPSVCETPQINEDVLGNLSREGVYLDMSDTNDYDFDSVFIFLRYGGRCSRFAVYNPQYEDESHYDPDETAGKKAKRDKVAASLQLLFKMLGVTDAVAK